MSLTKFLQDGANLGCSEEGLGGDFPVELEGEALHGTNK